MAKLEKEKHICKFRRLRYKSGNEIFFCALPDCPKKMNPALLLGKRSLCWRCGNEFIMNEYSLRLAKPHCSNCHKPKIDRIVFDTDSDTRIDEPIETMQSLQERLNQELHDAQLASEEDEI